MAYWISAEWDAPRGPEDGCAPAAPACTGCRSRLVRHSQVCRTGTGVEVAVHRLATGLHLEFGPLPGAVRDEAGAGQVRGGLVHLVLRRGGVSLQDAVGLVAVELLDGVGERFRRRIAVAQHGARRLLLGVRTCQQRNLGLLAGLEDCREGLWQEVAVQCGAETDSLRPWSRLPGSAPRSWRAGPRAYSLPPQCQT